MTTLIVGAKTDRDNGQIKSLLQMHLGSKYLILSSKAMWECFYSTVVSGYADIDEHSNIIDYVVDHQESTNCKDDLVVLVDTRGAKYPMSVNKPLACNTHRLSVAYIHVQEYIDFLPRETRDAIDDIYCDLQGLTNADLRKLYSYSTTNVSFRGFLASLMDGTRAAPLSKIDIRPACQVLKHSAYC